MINCFSVKTNKLKKNQIFQIAKLKDEHWKFGIESQINFIKQTNKFNDINNLFYLSNVLIGYTALRKRKFYKKNLLSQYLLFDTLIISKNFRGMKLSSLMMNFNNKIIKKINKPSFLICENKVIKYYKKFFWQKINKKLIQIMDHNCNNKTIMHYNLRLRKIDKGLKFNIFLKK